MFKELITECHLTLMAEVIASPNYQMRSATAPLVKIVTYREQDLIMRDEVSHFY